MSASSLAAERSALLDEWYQQIGDARPFLRWAGGKQLLLTRVGRYMPSIRGRYFEPFLGGASVFLYIQRREGRPLDAVLSDVNVPLIKTYAAIKTDFEMVAQRLGVLASQFSATESKSSFYYDVRERFNATLPSPDPADFIFINRTCWNALYRLNRRGFFNVPYGRPKTSNIFPTQSDLANASAALARARLRATPWENAVSQAKPGDFVFLDPPYYSDVEKDDMKYQARRFGLIDHERLAERLATFCDRGIDFILTNSAESTMIELYRSHGFDVHKVQVPRAISSKIDQRRSIDELMVLRRRTALLRFG